MTHPQTQQRSYTIESVLGVGGFGKVYLATMRAQDGFIRKVAIKLLKDQHPPESTLQRFRDEARILGLVDDRAVVGVEPPIRLNDHWAVVMDYVDGCSLAELRKVARVVPADVALSIIVEVVRALDKIWNQKGPDGQPLRLIHRDLKSGNLQLTESGEVKILDFGIAKAQFEERESHTTAQLAGTAGYIAPERLSGQEDETTDIFSLGVLLTLLITGKRAEPEGAWLERADPRTRTALTLAGHMRNPNPLLRPHPQEVEERIHAEQIDAGALKRWTKRWVPLAKTVQTDERTGQVLTANPTTADVSVTLTAPVSTSSTPTVGRLLGLGLLLSVAVFVCASLVSWPSSTVDAPQPVGVQPVVAAPVVAAPVVAAPVVAAPVVVTPTPVLQPAPPTIQPTVAPAAPSPNPEPAAPKLVPEAVQASLPAPTPPRPTLAKPDPDEPVPTVVPPTERDEPTASPRWPIEIRSLPGDASVVIDGVRRGTTPLTVELSAGSHTVSLQQGNHRHQAKILAGYRQPEGYFWGVEESEWSYRY